MPRSIALTPQQALVAETLIADGCYLDQSLRLAGIADSTYYRWRAAARLDPTHPAADFVRRIEVAEMETERDVVVSLRTDADWRARLEWLKRRHPDRWGDRREVTVRSIADTPEAAAYVDAVIALVREVAERRWGIVIAQEFVSEVDARIVEMAEGAQGGDT